MPATLVGADMLHDIAVLKLGDSDMKPLSKCTEPAVVGEKILAIGNPYGFDKSMSAGIISGVDRVLGDEHRTLYNLLQLDAAINPGNSGGPLLSADHGCVIGVNTAIASTSGSSAGLGFAIPIDLVTDIANDIIEEKHSKLLQLGIAMLPDSYSNALGVHGVIIADVLPNSIASELGLSGTYRDNFGRPMLGDIIIGINGQPIVKGSDIHKVLSKLSKGDKLELQILRSTGVESVRMKILQF